MKTGAVIVAAGMSSRMGEFKPMLNIGSISVAQRVIATLKQAGVNRIVVVTGYQAATLERHLSRDRDRHGTRPNALLADDLQDRRRKNGLGIAAVQGRRQLRRAVVDKRERTLRTRLVLRELDGASADVES